MLTEECSMQWLPQGLIEVLRMSHCTATRPVAAAGSSHSQTPEMLQSMYTWTAAIMQRL